MMIVCFEYTEIFYKEIIQVKDFIPMNIFIAKILTNK